MADFDIRDIAALKVKLQIIEKLVLADWILIILSMYYDLSLIHISEPTRRS